MKCLFTETRIGACKYEASFYYDENHGFGFLALCKWTEPESERKRIPIDAYQLGGVYKALEHVLELTNHFFPKDE